MTEQEALTKWCPMLRISIGGTATDIEMRDNRRVQDAGAALNCIASACMAWRWDGSAVHSPECASVATQMDKDPLPCDCNSVGHGHCGLAGDR